MLLGDVFENVRTLCKDVYKFDPPHFTAPGLGWDGMLKMTGVHLELLHDVDMLLMVERGMRGGLACVSKRYAKATPKATISPSLRHISLTRISTINTGMP